MKRNYSLIMLALFTMVVSSCKKFIEVDPERALTEEKMLEKLDTIDPFLLGIYTDWRDTKKDRGGFIFTLGTDEAQQGAFQVRSDDRQAGLDRYNGFLTASNSALTAQWGSRWLVIVAASKVVNAIHHNNEDPERKNRILGEASFIRAALTFEVSQYWGAVPIIDVEKAPEYGLRRQSLDKVYAFIIKDLENAVLYLPETQSDKRKVTKGAALALLGKVYLYAPVASGARDYTKAKETFQKVVDGGKYSLLPKYADLWNPRFQNTVESIYEFQFNNAPPDNNQTQWQMGSRSLAEFGEYTYFGGYDLMVPTKYAYGTTAEGGVWEAGDVRKEESIRYDFVYKGRVPVLNPTFGGDELDPHVKKYEDIRTDSVLSFWRSGKNIFFLRYSDILLCYAEAMNETGETAKAIELVNNTVRTRAFGGTLPADKRWSAGTSPEEFRTKMLDERMRELCFEGWRRMDLNRNGKLVDLVKVRNKWTAQSGTIQAFHSLYPIPLNEIKLNEDISEADQNPGYSNN